MLEMVRMSMSAQAGAFHDKESHRHGVEQPQNWYVIVSEILVTNGFR